MAVSTVNDSASSQTICAANAYRQGLRIYNESTERLLLSYTTPATVTNSFTIVEPYTSYTFTDSIPTVAIYGIWAANGSGLARVYESTGGTINTGTGYGVFYHPLASLATGLSTSAIDLLTDWTPGFAFKLLALEFATTIAGTGTSASQVFNLEIGTTNVTGGVLTLALADTTPVGKVKAATAITAANTGTSTDTVSLEMAASGTVFTAGAGYFIIKYQNLDTLTSV